VESVKVKPKLTICIHTVSICVSIEIYLEVYVYDVYYDKFKVIFDVGTLVELRILGLHVHRLMH
jgi:hypothetical protein